jgi:hypothetical protein
MLRRHNLIGDSQKRLNGSGEVIPFGDFSVVEICGAADRLIKSLIGMDVHRYIVRHVEPR